jgi:Bacterial protein of unknown function (DUF839)
MHNEQSGETLARPKDSVETTARCALRKNEGYGCCSVETISSCTLETLNSRADRYVKKLFRAMIRSSSPDFDGDGSDGASQVTTATATTTLAAGNAATNSGSVNEEAGKKQVTVPASVVNEEQQSTWIPAPQPSVMPNIDTFLLAPETATDRQPLSDAVVDPTSPSDQKTEHTPLDKIADLTEISPSGSDESLSSTLSTAASASSPPPSPMRRVDKPIFYNMPNLGDKNIKKRWILVAALAVIVVVITGSVIASKQKAAKAPQTITNNPAPSADADAGLLVNSTVPANETSTSEGEGDATGIAPEDSSPTTTPTSMDTDLPANDSSNEGEETGPDPDDASPTKMPVAEPDPDDPSPSKTPSMVIIPPVAKTATRPSAMPTSREPTARQTHPIVKTTPRPSAHPTSREPTPRPTQRPSSLAAEEPVVPLFNPGELTVQENGLLLSRGLTSRIIATTGRAVRYANNVRSVLDFHEMPDAGHTFRDTRADNPGGYIYVSNSEMRKGGGRGGVGAITFNVDGEVLDYQMVLERTTANCGGGPTPWGAWISCEETSRGIAYQVDPTGRREPTPITMGTDNPGLLESFAYDIRPNQDIAHFFITEDDTEGALRRFRPTNPDWDNPWTILTGSGTTDFLLLDPSRFNNDGYGVAGKFSWTESRQEANRNAADYYPNTEGIDVDNGILYMVSKEFRLLYILDLDAGTFTASSTDRGAFEGEPDQIQRLLNSSEHGKSDDELLFFTEDGGRRCGVHARLRDGTFVTILENTGYGDDETTGLAFSPDGTRMYMAYQDNGLLFEITRKDGLAFHATTLNVKYHASLSTSTTGIV